ncbi:MAG: GNAT family N-acetyltransferase [Robiginitalea sp.]
MTSSVQFRKADNTSDFIQIAGLADVIWREHYTPIIGKAQVDYMLAHFQSTEAIAQQVSEKMIYFLIQEGETPVGYLAIQKRGQELFLSKIYLLKEYRGLGMGKKAMNFIAEKAREFFCDRIALTVNKHNDRSIKAYSKMGFENKGPLVTDIGGGFLMDDYLMVRNLR